jgi:hypothetical protein
MNKPPRIHVCTVCGNKGVWSESWGWYGSYNHMDACPEDVPKSCSEECAKQVERNIKCCKWVLPLLSSGGAAGPQVTIGKKGY